MSNNESDNSLTTQSPITYQCPITGPITRWQLESDNLLESDNPLSNQSPITYMFHGEQSQQSPITCRCQQSPITFGSNLGLKILTGYPETKRKFDNSKNAIIEL